MELETKKIINLHKIDLRLQEIEEEKGDLPEIIQEQKEKIEKLNQDTSSSKAKITDLEKEKYSCDTSILDFEDKLEKYNKQMDNVKNNKEYDALLIEIDHLKKENDELTNKIIEIEETIKDLHNLIKECDEKINFIAEKLDVNESDLNDKSVEFNIEEKILLKDKQNILSKISDKNFIADYEDKDREILANIYNGSCSSCYTSLPAQSLVDAKKRTRFITCPSCSILLYLDEE